MSGGHNRCTLCTALAGDMLESDLPEYRNADSPVTRLVPSVECSFLFQPIKKKCPRGRAWNINSAAWPPATPPDDSFDRNLQRLTTLPPAPIKLTTTMNKLAILSLFAATLASAAVPTETSDSGITKTPTLEPKRVEKVSQEPRAASESTEL